MENRKRKGQKEDYKGEEYDEKGLEEGSCNGRKWN